MAIPGTRVNDIPPALPPPRYNNDLEIGFDLAWKWQNEHFPFMRRTLAPIKPDSSLWGGIPHAQRTMDDDEDVEMMDHDSSLHAQPIPRLQPQSQLITGTLPTLIRRPPSSTGINQRLQGENPLARQNHNQLTHAYDKHLLSKIGKSNSPPDSAKLNVKDHSLLGPKLSIQTRYPHLPPPAQEFTPTDPAARWTTSPKSTNSLTSRLSWREHSPGTLKSRSEPGLDDSVAYAAEGESLSDEASLHGLSMEDQPLRAALHGTKRRALSPPIEGSYMLRQDKHLPLRSPIESRSSDMTSAQPYNTRSISSTASSIQHSSCASSNLLCDTSSSMTSISSPSSVVRVMPEASKHPSLVIPSPAHEDLRRLITPVDKAAGSPRQSVTPISARRKAEVTPSRIGNYYMCSCCPKKPRKFETQHQLRIHENEKQYSCAYCSNRFKNKNEAERHQNSLHVRKQSWSCSAISTYQDAFQPSTFFDSRNSATDNCGFCGEEFTNHPTDWPDRIDHLTHVHKFGECNSSKKFYRADHFRQHLKHSHAGRSGKWTNILENNCLQEETPSDLTSFSPTASEH